jgi:hypothetical protein
LYGRHVRQQYSEQRAGGRVVHVEAAPGVVIVLAAWMLDQARYRGEIAAPGAFAPVSALETGQDGPEGFEQAKAQTEVAYATTILRSNFEGPPLLLGIFTER